MSVFGDATGNIARLLHFGYRPGGYAVMADGIPLGSATFTAVNTTGIPVLALGWA